MKTWKEFTDQATDWDQIYPLINNAVSQLTPEDFRERRNLSSQLINLQKTIEIKLGDHGE